MKRLMSVKLRESVLTTDGLFREGAFYEGNMIPKALVSEAIHKSPAVIATWVEVPDEPEDSSPPVTDTENVGGEGAPVDGAPTPPNTPDGTGNEPSPAPTTGTRRRAAKK